MIIRLIGLTMAATLATLPLHAADPTSDGQWFHSFLGAGNAHTLSTGAGVITAVVDSGVDGGHPDLSGSILTGIDLVTFGNGQTDAAGHGTAMAGLIVAHGRVNGIAPDARILPVRVTSSGKGSTDVLAQGIRWAAQHGARVISISRAVSGGDLLLQQVTEDAMAHDIVIVAAAGNRPEDQGVQWPAAIPGVVAVAGVDRDGNHSRVSVSGPEVVLAAPSDNISSTNAGGGYRVGTGTSDATAIVAGAVALVRSRFPQLKAAEVVRRLTTTAIDKGLPGRDNDYGYGIVNLVGALTADLPTQTTPAITAEPTTPTDRGQDPFRWWLIAIPVVVAVAALGLFAWQRRRTTR